MAKQNPMTNNSAQARKNSANSPWRKQQACLTRRAAKIRESFDKGKDNG